MIFKNRLDAAQKLCIALKEYENNKDTIILGLARGGVVLAAEIAKTLNLPFDLIMTRKIGAPMNPELAIGAITETGTGYFNDPLIETLQIPKSYIEQTIEKEKEEAKRRLNLYRKNRPTPSYTNKSVIIVDDGIATGATMMAAINTVNEKNPKEIIVATPVAPPDTIEFLSPAVDKIICLFTTEDFMAISQFYESFPQTQDSEIINLLTSE